MGVDETLLTEVVRRVKIRRALGSVGYPIDVIVISRDRFEETRDLIGGIAYPANRYGRVLYEAASDLEHYHD